MDVSGRKSQRFVREGLLFLSVVAASRAPWGELAAMSAVEAGSGNSAMASWALVEGAAAAAAAAGIALRCSSPIFL